MSSAGFLKRARRATGVVSLLSIPLLAGVACARIEPTADVPPYETLLMLLADFRRSAGVDLYRYEIPLDMTGQNAFRAALERLDSFEKENPDAYGDVVDFTRGEARARLGDFRGAVEAFNRAAARSDSMLAAKASERAESLARLDEAVQPAGSADRLADYLRNLERKQERLDALLESFGESPDAALARRERERVDIEYALALFRNRYVLEKGAAPALDFAASMLERHAGSRLIYAHRLMLGRFYLELAHDLADLTPPDRLDFDAALFSSLIDAARKQFLRVSQADGYAEKLEGAALLDAAESLARKVRNLSR